MGKPVIKLNSVDAWEPASRVSRSVATLTPYVAANLAGSPDPARASQIFKLDWNEATIAPSPKVLDAIQSYMRNDGGLNWYPELGSPRLCAALSDYTDLPTDALLVTNGSDEALALICNTFINEGDAVLVPVPTYNHFVVFAQARGAEIRPVEFANPFVADIDVVRDAMTPDIRVVYLVSPNNPTGAALQPQDVASFCEDFPQTLVVLDEAYYEFCRTSGITLVTSHPNLVVTRTFSKAFGLAGLRVGYLGAGPEIITGLRRIYNSKSVNTIAQVGAIAALSDLKYLNDYVDEVTRAKELVRAFFAQRDIEVQTTSANFVVVRVGDVAKTVDLLIDQDVYVRDRSDYPGMSGCLRMTVGTVEQTERLLQRLERVF